MKSDKFRARWATLWNNDTALNEGGIVSRTWKNSTAYILRSFIAKRNRARMSGIYFRKSVIPLMFLNFHRVYFRPLWSTLVWSKTSDSCFHRISTRKPNTIKLILLVDFYLSWSNRNTTIMIVKYSVEKEVKKLEKKESTKRRIMCV